MAACENCDSLLSEIQHLEQDNLELQGQVETMNATLALVEAVLMTLNRKLENL